jgi:hypothetical protein
MEKKTVRMQLKLAQSDVEALDAWRRSQPDLPNKSEAVRRLIAEANRALRSDRPAPKGF